jgi:hypothetical protein
LSRTSIPQQPSPPGTRRDSKTNLLEAAQAVVQDQHDRHAQERRAPLHSGVRQRVSILLLLALVGALLLVIRPHWLAGPDSLPAESPAIAEASLRLTMARERDRITAFVRQTGRLPVDLAEAGVSVPGLGYDVLENGAFRLYAQGKDSLLVLGSTDSMGLFLGTSLRDLKNRGRP